MKDTKRHLFHLVDRSPWPFFTAFSLLLVATGTGLFLHFYVWGGYLALLGFVLLVGTLICWWRDVVRENQLGYHSTAVIKGLRLGFILFIVSEILLFAAFFWAFFHASLSPSVWVGAEWPPAELEVFDPFGVPLANTILLLTSGASITWAHWGLLSKNFEYTFTGMLSTVFFAGFFLMLQIKEYTVAHFGMSDGVYGSTFYMLTGLHGFHVVVGMIFIMVCTVRYWLGHFTPENHLAFELAAWYWHFVDVVWLFLYISVYCWGNWVIVPL